VLKDFGKKEETYNSNIYEDSWWLKKMRFLIIYADITWNCHIVPNGEEVLCLNPNLE